MIQEVRKRTHSTHNTNKQASNKQTNNHKQTSKQTSTQTTKHKYLVLKVDTVRAYHLGLGLIVEVDVVLPENMPLKETHDIGGKHKQTNKQTSRQANKQ
jgi:divalent metal cation (Fe/Co/Zn/Cd) transporter